MLELENYRRNLHPAGIPHPGIHSNGTEPSLHPAGSSYPSFPSFQKNERQNPMANWSHDRSPLSSGPEPGYRSEEEDDEEYRPFTPPPPRERLSYTRYQLEMLNCIYTHARYPNSTQKQLIAKRVGITREQVKIWFQNRRRKDVVEKVKKKDKDEQDTSDTKSDHGDTKSDHGDSDSGVSDTSSTSNTGEDHGKSMVPDVVMKSVLAELRKFEKDLLKPKKKIKKKSKVTKQKTLKSHFTSALLSGEYDIINPPNQVVPSSALQRSGNKFSHSPRSSAFETPRDSGKYPSLLESLGPMFSPGHSPSKSCLNNPLNIPTSSGACDIPVLSDLLRSEQKQKDNCAQGVSSSYLTHRDRPYDFSNHHPHFGSPYTTPYGYIYPYHFITEPAIMLSSLRHPDSYRPYGHYTPIPYEHISASQLANPYFPPLPPPASWTNPNQSNSSSTPDTSYEQL